MSHFTVLVIGNPKIGESVSDFVERQLQPFNENDTDNPDYNPKWDWWEVGGRWTGFFKVKDGVKDFFVGRPGIMTEPAEPGYADIIKKGDIDLDGMRTEAAERAAKSYDDVKALFGGSIPKIELPWAVLLNDSSTSIEDKRDTYWNQPALKQLEDLRKNPPKCLSEEKRDKLMWLDLEKYQISREEYIQAAKNRYLTTFAVVKDEKWYERGEMGWWAVVTNEKEDSVWQEEFNKLINGLPDDTWLAVVDCHI